jgi:virulence-associated protein VagC
MRSKVTNVGVLIPKQWLEGIDEVEIRHENNTIIVIPIREHDPLLLLGTDPVTDTITDASIAHDRYIVEQEEQ